VGEQLAAAEVVYVPSQDKAARLVACWPAAAARVQVETMSHCVAVPGADPRVEPPAIDHEILFLGRLIRQKGVDDLLAAVSHMHPRPMVEIAGDGPERRRLERLAARLGVRARFHGFVQGEDKARLLRGAAVVCVPSREIYGGLSEGAPLVIREAFAYGVPVVATRVGGIPELCHGGAAWLVPAGRPTALREALRSALSMRRPPLPRPSTRAAGLC
jgi:colanic acid/amylovoran biosynthesis glycosyltransferase